MGNRTHSSIVCSRPVVSNGSLALSFTERQYVANGQSCHVAAMDRSNLMHRIRVTTLRVVQPVLCYRSVESWVLHILAPAVSPRHLLRSAAAPGYDEDRNQHITSASSLARVCPAETRVWLNCCDCTVTYLCGMKSRVQLSKVLLTLLLANMP